QMATDSPTFPTQTRRYVFVGDPVPDPDGLWVSDCVIQEQLDSGLSRSWRLSEINVPVDDAARRFGAGFFRIQVTRIEMDPAEEAGGADPYACVVFESGVQLCTRKDGCVNTDSCTPNDLFVLDPDGAPA